MTKWRDNRRSDSHLDEQPDEDVGDDGVFEHLRPKLDADDGLNQRDGPGNQPLPSNIFSISKSYKF